jgi:putative flippase GtrA
MDVDLSTDLDALLPLVAPLVSGHSDVAIGSRLASGSSVARRPKRELISRSYNAILRTVFATQVRDAQCGFKALRTDVAKRLLPSVADDGWFFDTELLLIAEHNGLRIHQVPVDWVDDPDSRVNVTRTAFEDLRGAARVARTFLAGRGTVDLGPAARPQLTDDFGRAIVSFGVIGTVSTLISLALFLALRGPIGPVAANAVALTATFLGNAWANARCTARSRRVNWRAAFLIYATALLFTSGALALVVAAGGGLLPQVATLAVTWTIASVGRFALVRTWSRPPTGARPEAPAR